MGVLEKNLQHSIKAINIQVTWKKPNIENIRKIEGSHNRRETSA